MLSMGPSSFHNGNIVYNVHNVHNVHNVNNFDNVHNFHESVLKICSQRMTE